MGLKNGIGMQCIISQSYRQQNLNDRKRNIVKEHKNM